ncbi:MAG: ribosome-associated translation inhibitor RaiA [Endomicrobiales bacterium]|nr:ribosome-associated translation inhibitor RaiA [Endomicrobiales bacterium]
MHIKITARHLDLTPALAEYARKKLDKYDKYLSSPAKAQVILSVEKKFQQSAEIIITSTKSTFRSKNESNDMYAAIDLALDKIEKQLKKHKEKVKVHRVKNKTRAVSLKNMTESMLNCVPLKYSEKAKISEVKHFDVKPVTLGEAIDEMELLGYDYYMFLNESSDQLNLLYRKGDGTFGLVEPRI